jgi:signal recognition particle receptor subunit beta
MTGSLIAGPPDRLGRRGRGSGRRTSPDAGSRHASVRLPSSQSAERAIEVARRLRGRQMQTMSNDDELIDVPSLGTEGARELLASAVPADVHAARREFTDRVGTPPDGPGGADPWGGSGLTPSAGAGDQSGAHVQSVPTPIKILISGGPGVGKTTMVAALSEIALQTVETTVTPGSSGIDDAGPSSSGTTVAMDFGRVTLDESTILYLFGFRGPERSSSLWDDLTDGALGAVVLVDPSRLEDCLAALHHFESIRLPYVVAVIGFAGRPTMSLDEVRTVIDVDVPVMAVDTRSREGVKAVVIAVLRRSFARAGHRG